jgi:ribA/ribD-fused uncharacterized protein
MAAPIEWFFTGPFRFLDNFYPHRQRWAAEGIWVDTVEHAFQASKSLDPRMRRLIALADSPARAKALGRSCALRPDWDAIKLDVMRDLLVEKFAPGSDLHARLLATAPRPLVEGNTWGDRIWGQDPVGVGSNWLGRLLMEIRGDGPRVEMGS